MLLLRVSCDWLIVEHSVGECYKYKKYTKYSYQCMLTELSDSHSVIMFFVCFICWETILQIWNHTLHRCPSVPVHVTSHIHSLHSGCARKHRNNTAFIGGEMGLLKPISACCRLVHVHIMWDTNREHKPKNNTHHYFHNTSSIYILLAIHNSATCMHIFS